MVIVQQQGVIKKNSNFYRKVCGRRRNSKGIYKRSKNKYKRCKIEYNKKVRVPMMKQGRYNKKSRMLEKSKCN